MKLQVKAMGFACGSFRWGSMALFALLSMGIGYGTWIVEFMWANGYIWYSSSLLWAAIGLVWGFIDWCVCGIVFALLYNRFVSKK